MKQCSCTFYLNGQKWTYKNIRSSVPSSSSLQWEKTLSWRFNLTVKKSLWIKSLIWISKGIFLRDENFQRKQGWFDYKCTKLKIPSGVIILKMKMLPKQNTLYGSIFQHTLIWSSLQTKSLSTTNSYGIKEIYRN